MSRRDHGLELRRGVDHDVDLKLDKLESSAIYGSLAFASAADLAFVSGLVQVEWDPHQGNGELAVGGGGRQLEPKVAPGCQEGPEVIRIQVPFLLGRAGRRREEREGQVGLEGH